MSTPTPVETDPFEDPASPFSGGSDIPEPPVVPAMYPGRCALCGAEFDTGDEIRMSDSGWAAVECCGEDDA